MQYIDTKAIEQLLAIKDKPLATLYIPMLTTASPPHITENQIRFKNLINQAVAQLEAIDGGQPVARSLREVLESRYHDLDFWESQTRGLLVCASPARIIMFHLPIDTEEYVAVDDAFHLAPVIALLNDQREYYVLAIAQHNPKLYKGNMYGLANAGVELPVSIEQALSIDESNQKSENQGSATGPSTNTGGFNGRGGARNPQEQDRIRFFRLIDSTVTSHIDRSSPLVLAGVESEVAEYRVHAKHPSILQQSIAGNHTATQPDVLFQTAHEIIWQALVAPEHQAALEDYSQLHATHPDKVALDENSVRQAATEGRVDTLLARLIHVTSDTVQDATNAVRRISFPDTKQSRALNAMVTTVHQMSGKVLGLPRDQMPDQALVAARLRY